MNRFAPRTFAFVVAAVLSLVSFSGALAQTSSLENTLLWRITGNGLTQPSYLYGTMHVTDGRVFNFGDSVVPAFLRCKTFASELRSDSMFAGMYELLFRRDSVGDIADHLTPEELAALEVVVGDHLDVPFDRFRHKNPSILLEMLDHIELPPSTSEDESPFEDFASDFGDLDDKEARAEFRKRLGEAMEEKLKERMEELRAMPRDRITGKFSSREGFLDAWLFKAAKLEGKKVLGLESIEEQMTTYDALPIEERVRLIKIRAGLLELDEDEEEVVAPWKLEEMIIDVYQSQDLNRILEIMTEELRPELFRSLLTERNVRMADRMVPIIRKGSTFVAVGTAHLPGEYGLIALMRAKGYTVEPVMSERPQRASAYKPPENVEEWFRYADTVAGYSVETPSALSPHPLSIGYYGETKTGKLMTLDFGTNIVYVVSVDNDIVTNAFKTTEERLESLVDYYAETSARRKRVTLGGIKGWEIRSQDDEGVSRTRVFTHGARNYVVAAKGTLGMIRSKDDTRFLASLRIDSMPRSWSRFAFPEGFVSATLPPGVQLDTAWGWVGGNYLPVVTAAAEDPGSGSVYLLRWAELPVFTFEFNDSSLVADFTRAPLSSIVAAEETQTPATILDNTGITWEASFGNDVSLKWQTWTRGGRVYAAAAIRPSGAESPREKEFFGSLRMSYPTASWKQRPFAHRGFSVALPFEPSVDSTSSEWSFYQGFTAGSRDMSDGATYAVRRFNLSPFYQVAHEDSAISDILGELIYVWRDSVLTSVPVEIGDYRGRDVVVGVGPTRNPLHLRLLLRGHTLYALSAFNAKGEIGEEDRRRFFESFAPDPAPLDILVTDPKLDAILAALVSSDSSRRYDANRGLQDVPATRDDLDKIYTALRADYPDDTEEDRPTLATFLDLFNDTLHDERSVDQITDVYRSVPVWHDIRVVALGALGRIGTDEAIERYLHLLTTESPTTDYLYPAFAPFDYGDEGVERIYPEILSLFNRRLYRDMLVTPTLSALDSGRITTRDLGKYQDSVRAYLIEDLSFYATYDPDEEVGTWDYATMTYRDQSEQERIYPYDAAHRAQLLGRLDPKPMVRQPLLVLLHEESPEVATAAAVALLRQGYHVEPQSLSHVARNPMVRVTLYREMEKLDMLDRFPAEYRNQRSIAEGLVVEQLYNSEEVTADSVEYVGEKMVEVDGEWRRVFLFRFHIEEDYDDTWYTALCSEPETLDVIDSDGSVIIWWDEYDEAAIDSYFATMGSAGSYR